MRLVRTCFAGAFLRATLAALAAAALAQPAAAQADYPAKPVRMVVGFPSGQAQDVLGRVVAMELTKQLGQQFFVDNRPGAAGIIAAQQVMGSAPDGYTLLLTSSGPLAVNPGLYGPKLPYEPLRDFMPVAGLAMVPLVMVAAPNAKATTMKDLVAMAKARPGAVNYASAGIGVTAHLVMEMFMAASGAKMTHVPYKGGPQALTDLMGGQVDVLFETTVATLPLVKQGRVKALAVSSPTRTSSAPEIPTVAELGYPGFSGVPWIVIMAPAHTPPAIVAKLNAEINKALATKGVQDSFISQGAEPMSMSPKELGEFIKVEGVKWAQAVKASGAKVD